MALPNKKWWEYVLPGCFKTKTSTSIKPSTQLPTQNSFQRLSLSDLSNPGSPLSVSDISNSRIGSNLHIFALAELKVITHNFSSSNFLGEGGFGPVYKGFIDDKVRPGLEAQPVAVKVLDLQGNQGHQEWLVSPIFNHLFSISLKPFPASKFQGFLNFFAYSICTHYFVFDISLFN